MYPPQSPTMTISRTSVTPATAPSNTTPGNLQNAPLMTQPGTTHSNYPRNNNRTRRSKAIPIIDPNTGEDKLDEIFESENASHPASGESSARQTPQPAPPNPNKEVITILIK